MSGWRLAAFSLAILVCSGCGRGETQAERRQREAVDLCYHGFDCLKAGDTAKAKSLFKQALELDLFCEKAKIGLERVARENARVLIGPIETAVKKYILDVGTPPESLDDLCTAPSGVDRSKWKGPYLQQGLPLDPWGKPFQYAVGNESSGSAVQYEIWTVGEDGELIGDWQSR